MNRIALALSSVVLFVSTGCAHRVVYTEGYEPEPVVVHRTVVVDRPPHYHHRHHRPHHSRVVVSPRPHHGGVHRQSARREERPSAHRATVRARGGVRIQAEASAR